MKTISEIREVLQMITGCLQNTPPNWITRGNEPAVTLHNPSSVNLMYCAAEPEKAEDTPNDTGRDGELECETTTSEFDPFFEIGSDMDKTIPALGGDENERIRQSVLLHGVDALGWYIPFHYPGAQWGIYIRVTSLVYMASDVFGRLKAPPETKLLLAMHAILNHELFHFATEYAIAQMEIIHREPWFIESSTFHRKQKPGYLEIEEELANAYMLRAFRTMTHALRVPGKTEALKAFTLNQPAGYKEGCTVRREHWEKRLMRLGISYTNGEPVIWGYGKTNMFHAMEGYDWAAHFPIWPKINWRYCPIHLIDDGARVGIPPDWIKCFSKLSDIKESEHFRGKLATMAPPIQRAWERTKQKLQVAITRGADFKKWPKDGRDVYSVRVNDNFRAHLQLRQLPGDWSALKIGNHNEMGHG